jgi:hypothetical protein
MLKSYEAIYDRGHRDGWPMHRRLRRRGSSSRYFVSRRGRRRSQGAVEVRITLQSYTYRVIALILVVAQRQSYG